MCDGTTKSINLDSGTEVILHGDSALSLKIQMRNLEVVLDMIVCGNAQLMA